MSNSRHDYRFHLHREHFLRHVDPANTKGLEIGAFDLPMVAPNEGNCEFADYRSTAELRELAGQIKGHNPDFVVPIKHELKFGYDGITGQYHWIAAAHVIEHIPDVIGWLKTLATKLADGGVLFLIIPDKRFTFDYYRTETVVRDLADAHRLRLTQPSFAQVFDHFFRAVPVDSPDTLWAGGVPPAPAYDYHGAMAKAEQAQREYVDAHCSVFSPESFSREFLLLQRAGAIPLALDEVRSTQVNQLDFSAIFRKQ